MAALYSPVWAALGRKPLTPAAVFAGRPWLLGHLLHGVGQGAALMAA